MKTLCTILFVFFLHQSVFAQSEYQKIKISDDLELIKISESAYIHISHIALSQVGRFPSNGMVIISEGKAFLFDTPMTEELTRQLALWIQDTMKLKIMGFIPNHWHADCMGGLEYLQNLGIESYANEMTIQIAKSKQLPVPTYGFKDSLQLFAGNKAIHCYYFGAGHSSDNIVVWIPSEKILFGGCMVKELSANGLGNIVDADLKAWPRTLDKVLKKFHNARIVVPGHGKPGGVELLRQTKELLIAK